MSYQVLARKWRPQTFHQLVGQDHVKQALVNALNEQRLHHAYLFTGTRGVGKTTIARIFAKSLNCEQGISAQPCGQCSTCLDIEAGKYIDLIEIDAASRTKVEDTREILDNVQYAPTRGQFKVYLIDEVHMLSKHSFNALLKTLEEPPEHVKFLLATTDPQKLPVTILSRCLQFNLSALSVQQISTQLAHVLSQEQLDFEQPALAVLAKAADGSMRDALSLTDQAIAQTNGQLHEGPIKDMLGLMDVRYAQQLLSAVLLGDGDELIQQIRNLAQHNPNYIAVLDDLLNLTHSVQLTQLVPSAALLNDRDSDYITEVANTADTQHIHLIYQLLLAGKRDLQWASSAQVGFEMLMLRLLAFEPQYGTSTTSTAQQTPPRGDNEEKTANLRAMLARNKAGLENTAQPQPQPQPQEPRAAAQQSTSASEPQRAEPAMGTEPAPAQSVANGGDNQGANAANSQYEADSQDEQHHEAMAAQQFEQVMQQAHEQGYQPHTENAQTAVTSEQGAEVAANAGAEQGPAPASPAQQLDQLQDEAQSAIARILKNRKLGTSSRPVQEDDSAKKAEARTKRATAVSTASQETANAVPPVKTKVQRQQSPAQRLMDKHQPDPQKLAPELVEQLEAPATPRKESQQEQVAIAAPEGFESSVSDVKFAHQQDDWAHIIESMGLGGRIRQFALHSRYQKQGTELTLHVEQSQRHLDSSALRERLQQGLAEHFKEPLNVQIEFVDELQQTPFLIQQSIDGQRYQQAVAAVKADEHVQQMMTQFSATLDENSVQAL
ncbi:DNA polymerase III subunit gamma/tau [Pseudoalteromonas ruthenica]|uniref:DNA polymerase III subunit gamma/tau n=1 Tax=Pseudoalteromonas ruthenica TaxID=151081 RepID=A0A0F4Q2D7_9GAMM|nr:DNA polymerase III subunit gamma/tau [Pseudoalteromonas ruthenica]KJZ00722.1 hypothetical protein TW76_00445 [Pseudoalteromonas ruthenica]KJZ01224.1 hypothetical protein TW72_05165 [Pseudoalteromonas ruthenica]TMO92694.1 DNA polymerase III subunit gamma/tau [Pseudoalteromonas ruthenica]TMO96555.1 DNA polymerase III subunit gamma/tau [Pseudoalteromonas ruthenica]TMP03473.1 DNA polymerase III subunit gamma/tau [Pseudoalteromonas ruthenica]